MRIKICVAFFCALAITECLRAQPPQPIMRFDADHPRKGYYLLGPYKTRKGTGLIRMLQMILDGNGRILVYNQIKGSDFKLQPNHLISYSNNKKFYLMDQTFKTVDSVACVGDFETDIHDFLITPGGEYLLIGKESHTEDFSEKLMFMNKGIGGSKRAIAKYDVIQVLDKNKKLVYQWNSRDFFSINDSDPFYLKDTDKVDVAHVNSAEVDQDGNFIVSSRYRNEVFKILRSTGQIAWHFGGKQNNLKLLDDTLFFSGQHDARLTRPGRLTLFDNGFGDPSREHNARALEYEVNDSAKTAKLLWAYANETKIVSEAAGNVQRLKNGNTLVCYGKIRNGSPNLIFEVVNPKGEKQVVCSFADTMATYRAFYYDKLPFEIKQPDMKCTKKNKKYHLETKQQYAHYVWCNGEKTPTTDVTGGGDYFVYVSNDNVTFTRSKIKRLKALKP